MNNCDSCDGSFRNDPNKIICDGNCRQSFHAACVNFSAEGLLCYREMPNLQWFCDNCIIQARSVNVSFPQFDKFNSAAALPTSSPFELRRSLIAAKSRRKHKHSRNQVPNTKSKSDNSDFLVTRPPSVKRGNTRAKGSIIRSPLANVQPRDHIAESKGMNELIPLATSMNDRSDVTQTKTQRKADVSKVTLNEPLKPQTPSVRSVTSSPTKELTKSPVAVRVCTEIVNSVVQPQTDSIHSPDAAAPCETRKSAYVSNFDPSITEENVVNYLLRENVISRAEDVSCKILVSPYVDMDSISFVSFKITVSSEMYDSVVNRKLWPEHIVVREFVKH